MFAPESARIHEDTKEYSPLASFRRKPESMLNPVWIPAFAGMTEFFSAPSRLRVKKHTKPNKEAK